jgi:putative tryptophan/tyrosine transport system substrate-binding protein
VIREGFGVLTANPGKVALMESKQMKIRRRRCVIVVLTAMLLSASSPFLPKVSGETKEHIVAVSQFIQHPALDALLRGFMEYFQSRNILVKYNIHIAQGDTAINKNIAEQIAREPSDLVLTISTPSSQACLKTISNRPIVFSAVTDPVGAGLVKSLDTAGPNITGMTDMSPVDRQFELIKELQPGLKKLGVIYNPKESNSVSLLGIIEKECSKQGFVLLKRTVTDKEEVAAAVRSLVRECDALYLPTDNTVISAIEMVARICGQNRLPLYAADVESVPHGAIVSLAIDYYVMGRQTAGMAARIFDGVPPSSMPVESLKDLRIHINLKAAEIMGIELPVNLLQAADVIYNSFPP